MQANLVCEDILKFIKITLKILHSDILRQTFYVDYEEFLEYLLAWPDKAAAFHVESCRAIVKRMRHSRRTYLKENFGTKIFPTYIKIKKASEVE